METYHLANDRDVIRIVTLDIVPIGVVLINAVIRLFWDVILTSIHAKEES
jgi:hypothetical protein